MKITIKKDALIKAMQDYNVDVTKNPGNFEDIDESEDCANKQVEQLISYIPEHHQDEVMNDIQTNVVSSFMSFCEERGKKIPEKFFLEFFDA